MTQPSTAFYIKQGDRSPSISEILRNAPVYPSTTPEPIDLTNGTVRFHLIDTNGAVVVDQPATVTDAVAGIVTYDWAANDTLVAGDFYREWEVTLVSGKKVTVPNDRRGYVVHIEKQSA